MTDTPPDPPSLMDKLNAMQATLDKSLVESIGGAIFELSAIILRQQQALDDAERRLAALETRGRWPRRRRSPDRGNPPSPE